MRGVAIFTMVLYMGVIVGTHANKKPIVNANNTDTVKRQKDCGRALDAVNNLKARYMDAIIQAHVNKKPIVNVNKDRR